MNSVCMESGRERERFNQEMSLFLVYYYYYYDDGMEDGLWTKEREQVDDVIIYFFSK